MSAVDVLIAGAGPVGAACALFLAERGIATDRVLLVDARPRAELPGDERMIAVSHGTALLLERLGVWPLAQPHATPITTIHVSHRGHFGRTLIEANEHGVPALGHVIRHADLVRVFDGVLADRGFVVRRPARIVGVDDGESHASVTLDDGVVEARFVVHAEGGLFDGQAKRAVHRDYGQTAVTSFVTLARDPGPVLAHTAFERFTEHGPIALLPARLPGDDGAPRAGYALVWCCRPEEAAMHAAAPNAAFVEALGAAFGRRLGAFATATPRRTFPLGLNALKDSARVRGTNTAEFAIGNAAQTLHPVAGQGLNLGIRDAHALAAVIATRDASAATRVSRFESDRRLDRAVTVDLTDLMPRLFANDFAPAVWMRGAALGVIDAIRPLRDVFARQMMNGRR